MNNLVFIRRRIKLTQSALAKELGVSQANVSHYENGQEIPPGVARKLIEVATSRGFEITYDDIYSEAINA